MEGKVLRPKVRRQRHEDKRTTTMMHCAKSIRRRYQQKGKGEGILVVRHTTHNIDVIFKPKSIWIGQLIRIIILKFNMLNGNILREYPLFHSTQHICNFST